jgi:hypothetical protein
MDIPRTTATPKDNPTIIEILLSSESSFPPEPTLTVSSTEFTRILNVPVVIGNNELILLGETIITSVEGEPKTAVGLALAVAIGVMDIESVGDLLAVGDSLTVGEGDLLALAVGDLLGDALILAVGVGLWLAVAIGDRLGVGIGIIDMQSA